MEEHKEITSFNEVVSVLSKKIDGFETTLTKKFDGLSKKIDGVETSLGKRINGVEADLTKKFKGLSEKIDGVETSLNDAVDVLARQINGIDGRLDGIDGRLDGIDGQLDSIDGRLTKVEATMVTKNYLDDKMADLRGDIMQVIGMENDKVLMVVDVLHDKKLVTVAERQTVRLMKPFPKR